MKNSKLKNLNLFTFPSKAEKIEKKIILIARDFD